MKIFTYIAGALLLLWSGQLQSAPCQYTLRGRVYTADGKALEGASIYITELERAVVSDAQGYYEINKLCEGNYTLLISFVGFQTITAQTEAGKSEIQHQDFVMQENTALLRQVEITDKREERFFNSQIEEKLSEREMSESRGKSIGEALKQITGVNTLNTGASIAKPMIHGLHSNRILILNNGVRLEGQQWGLDHAPEIDPFSAKELSVIKGAASVQYGADAIGGVVLVKPAPLPTQAGLQGELSSLAMSNGRQGALAAMLQNAHGAWAWRLQGSYRRSGDLQAANYLLSNTGAQESALSAALGYRSQKHSLNLSYSYFGADLGILRSAHIGNLDDLERAMRLGRPAVIRDFSYDIENPRQAIGHHTAKLHGDYQWKSWAKLHYQYALQYNRRREFDIRRGGRSAIPALSMALFTNTWDVYLEHQRSPQWNGKIGLSGMWQVNNNTPDSDINPIVPNYDNLSQGLFVIQRYQQEKYELEIGARYEYRRMTIVTFDDNREIVRPSYNFHNLSANIGASYYISDKHTLRSNIGTAWRPPNVNELFSRGLHHGSGAIEQGLLYEQGSLNTERPFGTEQALKWTNSWEAKTERWEVELSTYYQYIQNFVYLVPFNVQLTLRGAFPVFTYLQTNAAFTGFDATASYQLHPRLRWQGKASVLYAEDVRRQDALINMPPYRFESMLTYELSAQEGSKWQDTYLSLKGSYVARQYRAPGVVPIASIREASLQEASELQAQGIYDFLAPPADYFLLHLYAGTKVQWNKQQLEIGMSVENLLNVAYRDYLNRFRYYADDLGRNVSLRLQYRF